MPSRKYTCPRCNLAFVSRKSPRNIRCPACGATLPPPPEMEDERSLSFLGLISRVFVGGFGLLGSPVVKLTEAVGSVGVPTPASAGSTPAEARRNIGLVVCGVLFVGFVIVCVTFMIRAVKETPDPDKIKDQLAKKLNKSPQPQQPPGPESHPQQGKQTGVPVIDAMHIGRAPDIDLVFEQIQSRYDIPGSANFSLPRLEAVKIWTLAELPAADAERQKQYDLIVDRFLLYRSGKLAGADGQKAVNDFSQLALDATPALVRGLNLAALREDNAALVIARKLRAVLDGTEDSTYLAYSRENLGRDVNNAPQQRVLDAFQEYLEQRLARSKDQLKQNLPQLMAALNHRNPHVRAEAANALGNLGPQANVAIPQLTKALKDPNKTVRGKAARALVEAGPEAVPSLMNALQDQETRPAAAAALAQVRPVPPDALGALIENLKEAEPEQRGPAQAALVSIGAPAVPPLIKSLQDKDRRNGAALTLGHIGKPAEPALPDLMAGLKDPDATFRVSSHHALVHLGPTAVPQLAQALKDANDYVWYSAALALGKIGPAARAAVPALIEAMKGDNKSLRILALNALIRIDPDHRAIGSRLEEIVPVLIDSLQHEAAAIRSWSCVCLGKIGRGARPAVAALAATLRDKELSIRILAAVALGQLGAEAKEAAAALIAAFEDSPTQVRAAVTAALSQLGAAVTADLVAALKHKHDAVRSGAVEVLARIGVPAVPTLVPALKDEDSNSRRLASQVLQKIGPSAREAVPGLLANLKDSDRQVRYATVQAIRAIRPNTLEALSALWQALDDNSGVVADEARRALASWKFERAVVPVVQSHLEEKDPGRRVLALTILGNVGPDAKGAVPALIALLKDRDARIRLNVADSLGLITPTESATLTALTELLHDNDPGVCTAAQSALVKAGPAAVPGLTQALEDKDARVRQMAAAVLPRLGPTARSAVPNLVNNCTHDDGRVRLAAVGALRELDPESPAVLPVFIERLKDPDDEVRLAAQASLLKTSRESLPFLIKAVGHKDVAVRRGVVELVKKIGMEGTSTNELLLSLGELVAGLKDADKQVRDEVAWALGEIDPELKSAAPALAALARQPFGKGDSAVKSQADFRYVPEAELLAAATAEQGTRLKNVLEEIRKRRGDRVLATLAWATLCDDADVQQAARKLVRDYLSQKPKPGEEQQAAARLKLNKRLEEDGKKAAAQQRYRELIRDLPHTRGAEEARKLLMKQ